jgi:hypothetical protein
MGKDLNIINSSDHLENIVEKIYESKGYTPTKDFNANLDFLDDIRLLRNQICHNNNGTPNKNFLAKIDKYDGVLFDGEITINNREIIDKSLKSAYFLLKELCKAIGFEYLTHSS